MLIFRQKSFQFCTPGLKNCQPVLPQYIAFFRAYQVTITLPAIRCPLAKQFLWCCRARLQSGWMNLKHLLRQRGPPSESIFMFQGSIQNGLKLFLKQPKCTMGVNVFLKAQFKIVICCQWKPTPAQSADSTHPTMANLPKLAQVFSEPSEVPCYTNW